MPNRGPPATPDEEGGQADEDEKGPPHDGPHLSLGDPPGHRLDTDYQERLHASKPRIWPRLLVMLIVHGGRWFPSCSLKDDVELFLISYFTVFLKMKIGLGDFSTLNVFFSVDRLLLLYDN